MHYSKTCHSSQKMVHCFNVSTNAGRQNEKSQWWDLTKWLQRKSVEEETSEDRSHCLDLSPRSRKVPTPGCAQQRIQSEKESINCVTNENRSIFDLQVSKATHQARMPGHMQICEMPKTGI